MLSTLCVHAYAKSHFAEEGLKNLCPRQETTRMQEIILVFPESVQHKIKSFIFFMKKILVETINLFSKSIKNLNVSSVCVAKNKRSNNKINRIRKSIGY